MADIIRALTESVDKLGAFVFVAVVVILAAIWVGRWNSRLVSQVLSAQSETQKLANQLGVLSGEVIQRNTVANNANTESNLKVAAAIDKNTASVADLSQYMQKFGSDPMNICRLQMFLDKNNIPYRPDQLPLLAEQLAKMEAKRPKE